MVSKMGWLNSLWPRSASVLAVCTPRTHKSITSAHLNALVYCTLCTPISVPHAKK